MATIPPILEIGLLDLAGSVDQSLRCQRRVKGLGHVLVAAFLLVGLLVPTYVRAANYYINASGAMGNGSGSSAANAADASSALKYSNIINAQNSSGTVINFLRGDLLCVPGPQHVQRCDPPGSGYRQDDHQNSERRRIRLVHTPISWPAAARFPISSFSMRRSTLIPATRPGGPATRRGARLPSLFPSPIIAPFSESSSSTSGPKARSPFPFSSMSAARPAVT